MADELRMAPRKGGFRGPISVRQFILDHLAAAGEDYIASMHRAYKAELIRLAEGNGRSQPYHAPRYHSFEMVVYVLTMDGLVKFSGREEPSDAKQFENREKPLMRRYFRLV